MRIEREEIVKSGRHANPEFVIVSKPQEPHPKPHTPELSRFFGIVIGVFYREHGRPHFHAVYGEFEAVIASRPVKS